eukprot:scpid36359/ scgid1603/ Telomerase-binding protein EST1A; EST1-like protein A; Ever shorter telomeres 1A; Smg-6 homolog; Telomerase subunit EST1A
MPATMSSSRISVSWKVLSSTAEWLDKEESKRREEKKLSRRSRLATDTASHGVLSRLPDKADDSPRSSVETREEVLPSQQSEGRRHAAEKVQQIQVDRHTGREVHSTGALDDRVSSRKHADSDKLVAANQHGRVVRPAKAGLDSSRAGILRVPAGTSIDADAAAACEERQTAAAAQASVRQSKPISRQERPPVRQPIEPQQHQQHRQQQRQQQHHHQQQQQQPQRRRADDSLALMCKRIGHLEQKVTGLIERDVTPRTISSIVAASEQLQAVCIATLLQHSGQSLKAKVDQKFWRYGCYAVVEALRRKVQETAAISVDSVAFWQQHLLAFVEKSNELLLELVEKLQEQASLDLSALIERERAHLALSSKAKLAVVLCHNCFIWMGDLARYSQEVEATKDWSLARQCYMKATDLTPRNGKPHNQLAILALHTRRKLDAIFYYIRALSVRTPILTAKEALLSLFDDISRKTVVLDRRQEKEAQATVKKEASRKARHNKRDSNRTQARGGGSRRSPKNAEEEDVGVKEVWVHPLSSTSSVSGIATSDSNHSVSSAASLDACSSALSSIDSATVIAASTLHQQHVSLKKSISSDSVRKLKKYVILRFLRLHGMMHTKIGMEHFKRVCTAFRRDLDELVQSLDDSTLTFTKMMIINVFALHRILVTAAASSPETSIPVHKETTSVFAVLMDALLSSCNAQVSIVNSYLDRTGKTFDQALDAGSSPDSAAASLPGLSRLSSLLPAVWVGLAWLNNDLARRIDGFPWQSLADLLNSVRAWPLDAFVKDYDESCGKSLITPVEDHLLNGFLPLQSCFEQMPAFHKASKDTPIAILDFAVRGYMLLACAQCVVSKRSDRSQAIRLQLSDSPDQRCADYVVCLEEEMPPRTATPEAALSDSGSMAPGASPLQPRSSWYNLCGKSDDEGDSAGGHEKGNTDGDDDEVDDDDDDDDGHADGG